MSPYTAHGSTINLDCLNVEHPIQGWNGSQTEVSIYEDHIDRSFPRLDNTFSITRDSAVINWSCIGTFLIKQGREIIIEPDPNTDQALALSCLLGRVMAILMYQRGSLVLHASSLEIGGKAVGIGAHSGTGKSTFAAYLATRGHGYLTDDMIPLKTEEVSTPQVYPGFPLAKLHPETASALNIPPERITPISAEMEKKFVSFPPREDPMQAYPLHALYILNEGAEVNLTRLPAQLAAMELVTHSFSRIFAQNEFQTTGDKARLQKTLQQCAWLAGKVPVYRLTRPRDFALLPRLAEMIESNVRESG